MHGSTDDLFLVMIMGADYHYSVISVIIIRSFTNGIIPMTNIILVNTRRYILYLVCQL